MQGAKSRLYKAFETERVILCTPVNFFLILSGPEKVYGAPNRIAYDIVGSIQIWGDVIIEVVICRHNLL